MKIAFVYDAIYPFVKGGGEKRIHDLAVRLASRGHEIHLYGLKFWDGPLSVKREGLTLHGVIPAMQLYAGQRRAIPEAVFYGAGVFPALIRDRFDVVDCQQFPYFSGLASRVAASMRKDPLAITWYEVWGEYWDEYLGAVGGVGKFMDRVLTRLSPYHIAISAAVKKRLDEKLSLPGATVIPHAIDIHHIDRVRPAAESPDILFAGRFIREKNIGLLIAAVDRIREEKPDVSCMLVGDGPEMQHLVSEVRRLHLERNVTFTGFLEDHDQVLALMKTSRVFAFPSAREGYGIGALEALACGTPLVTLDHEMNAAKEFVTEKTGFLTTESPEELGHALMRALERSGDLSPSCREYSRMYDWEEVCSAAERYYSWVAADFSARGR
ncbi:glycosyltransferase involved in cell wall biosynthesis [Methanolinea mesophila]|uniref:glycosyltransferase family 4 protein n=1 Tax=Methanolinea mesophila TaxID=547055 RepID=UPI001AE46425|nr:glycosyltransferase family 4 protein [Methanolinea mesophila]MBP1928310.1 glycosyltransferase involved in cell wall biosynthesis [Methanolinea mesophila]